MCTRMRSAKRVILGARFRCSKLLGGADADLIVDGELLDLKTTSRSSPLSREYLWQMLGYVMADTNDEHGIEYVGFIWPRWQFRSRWHVDDFVAILGGGETSVDDLRQSFREMCEQLPARPASPASEQACGPR